MADQQLAESTQITALESTLKEKEALILALTSQLEDAAEQLDRVRRTGSDLANRGSSGDAFGSQAALLTDLAKVVDSWEEQQPGLRLQRVEQQLEGLQTLLEQAISGGLTASSTGRPSPPPPASGEKRDHDAPKAKKAEASSNDQQDRRKESMSAWESMKAQLLADEDLQGESTKQKSPQSAFAKPQPAAPATQPVTAATPAAENSAEPQQDSESESGLDDTLLVIPDAPAPIPVDIATRNELIDAIESRDQYVHYLVGRLRSEQQRTSQPIVWEELNNAPAELRSYLEALGAELEENLKISEVDLSLERARLSRVQANIELTQKRIEKHLQQQVGRAKAAGAAEDASHEKARGWFSRKKS